MKVIPHNAITQCASGNTWADVSRSSIRFTYSSVARHIGPCICPNSQTYTWNDVIPYKGRMIRVFFMALRPNAALGLVNPLNPELNPMCCLLALLEAHHFLYVSRIRVKSLTFRRLMSYIYGAPIPDVSRSHTTQHSR